MYTINYLPKFNPGREVQVLSSMLNMETILREPSGKLSDPPDKIKWDELMVVRVNNSAGYGIVGPG